MTEEEFIEFQAELPTNDDPKCADNEMCRNCMGLLKHVCSCPKQHIRFCECKEPKELEYEENIETAGD